MLPCFTEETTGSGLYSLSGDIELFKGITGIETWVCLAPKVHRPCCLSVVLEIGYGFPGLECFHQLTYLISFRSPEIHCSFQLFVP